MPDFDRKHFAEQKLKAKQRGIEWQLEYWEWLQIWQDSGHLHERGPHKGQWVMGRNGDTGPYAIWNVKIIRCETNSSFATLQWNRLQRTRYPTMGSRRVARAR